MVLSRGLVALGRSDEGKVLPTNVLGRPEGFETAEIKAAKAVLVAAI